jgi:hypothetical protein
VVPSSSTILNMMTGLSSCLPYGTSALAQGRSIGRPVGYSF